MGGMGGMGGTSYPELAEGAELTTNWTLEHVGGRVWPCVGMTVRQTPHWIENHSADRLPAMTVAPPLDSACKKSPNHASVIQWCPRR